MSEEQKSVEETPKNIRLPDMSTEDMRQFILGVCDGQIFTDRHCRHEGDVGHVFMILMFMKPDDYDWNDIGCIWEWMREANPMSVNGMPSFFSAHLMNKKDADFAFKMIRQEQERRDNLKLQLEIDMKERDNEVPKSDPTPDGV